jgi:uncharacterized YigZ family protein
MTTQEYTTLAAAVGSELEISRSRFLGLLAPASDEAAARAHIEAVRALHPRARHRCTAMVVGPRGELERSNDDGEPSGTAGAPMLEALRAEGVTDVVAVVVRYFGGVLLGTGGLARAYRGAVADALAVARTVVRRLLVVLEVRTGYAEAAAVEVEARRRGWRVEADYGADVTLTLAVEPHDVEPARACVERASAGSATARDVGTRWV